MIARRSGSILSTCAAPESLASFAASLQHTPYTMALQQSSLSAESRTTASPACMWKMQQLMTSSSAHRAGICDNIRGTCKPRRCAPAAGSAAQLWGCGTRTHLVCGLPAHPRGPRRECRVHEMDRTYRREPDSDRMCNRNPPARARRDISLVQRRCAGWHVRECAA